MSGLWKIILVGALGFGSAVIQTAAAEEADFAIGNKLADMLRASRSVVSVNQGLINDPDIGDKQFSSEKFVQAVDTNYLKRVGTALNASELSKRDRRLFDAQRRAMRLVIDDHQAEINRSGVGFKGFIPAIFERLTNEEFGAIAGQEARIRVTAPPDLARNRKARPDPWEKNILETRFLTAGLISLIGSSIFLSSALHQTADRTTKMKELFDVVGVAGEAHVTFGEFRYWLTDLSVSQLVISERNASAARKKLDAQLDRLKIHDPETVAAIRAEAEAYFSKAMDAADAYTDGNRVIGNTLLARARAHSSKADEALLSTVHTNLGKINEHGMRADAIVKNMLLHSREGPSEPESVNMNTIAEEALNLAYHGARAEHPGFNIEMIKSLDPDLGEIECYPQDLMRVFLNLISNGMYAVNKHSKQAGEDISPTISLTTHILMVDDEPDAQELFRQNFRREIREGAYSFDFALSGEAALDQLKGQQSPRAAMVLPDINMPGMSGIELLAEIRDTWGRRDS